MRPTLEGVESSVSGTARRFVWTWCATFPISLPIRISDSCSLRLVGSPIRSRRDSATGSWRLGELVDVPSNAPAGWDQEFGRFSESWRLRERGQILVFYMNDDNPPGLGWQGRFDHERSRMVAGPRATTNAPWDHGGRVTILAVRETRTDAGESRSSTNCSISWASSTPWISPSSMGLRCRAARSMFRGRADLRSSTLRRVDVDNLGCVFSGRWMSCWSLWVPQCGVATESRGSGSAQAGRSARTCPP